MTGVVFIDDSHWKALRFLVEVVENRLGESKPESLDPCGLLPLSDLCSSWSVNLSIEVA